MELLDDGSDCLLDSDLDAHRLCTGSEITKTFLHHRLSKDRRGGGSITCDVVGLLCDLLDQLCAHVLGWIGEFDLLCDGHAIVCDHWCTEGLTQDDIASLWSQSHLDCVGEDVDSSLHCATSVLVELQTLTHVWSVPVLLVDDREDVAS